MNNQLKISPDEKTGHCDKHGPYPLKAFKNYDGTIKYVGSCQECIAVEKAERLKQRTEYSIKSLMKYSGIPERFLQYSFDDFQTGNHACKKQALQSIKDYVRDFGLNREKGRCLTMYGGPGTGKTMLACCMAKAIIHKTYSTYEHDELTGSEELITHDYFERYLTEYSLIRKIKSSWSGTGETEEYIINNLCESDLLIIDEVGVSFGSEAEKVLFYQVINGRYERTLPTVLISNFNLSDLEKHCGSRIIDRLKENEGMQLIFNWESYRR